MAATRLVLLKCAAPYRVQTARSSFTPIRSSRRRPGPQRLEELITRFFAAKAAEEAEKMIDVTSVKPEPDPAPIEPERGPEDGEAVWSSDNIDDPHCKHDQAEER